MKRLAAISILTILATPAFAQTDLQSLYNSSESSSLVDIMKAPAAQQSLTTPSSPTSSYIAPITADNVKLPKEKFVTNRDNTGWSFLMGPEASTNEEMMLYKTPDQNGGVSFICRRSDNNGMIIVLNDKTNEFKKPITVNISIDGNTHPQKMTPGPSGKIGAQNKHSLMFVGDAGIAIMKAMSNVPSGREASMKVTYDGKPIATVPLPTYSSLAYQAANICLGWNELKHEAQMEHENILPTQAHVIGINNDTTNALPK